MFRIRDRSRWLTEGALRDELALGRLDRDRADGLLDAKKPSSQSPNPLIFGEELQFWQDRVCLMSSIYCLSVIFIFCWQYS